MSQLLQLLLTSIGKLIAIGIGFYFFKTLSTPYRLVLAQVIVVLFCELTGYYISFRPESNAWLFNIFYFLPELWLMGLAGYGLGSQTLIRKITPLLLIAGTAVWAINILALGINTLANWALIYISISLAIIYLNILINSSLFKNDVARNPSFWLAISVVFFFCCTIPYFGLYNVLVTQAPGLLKSLFAIHQFFNIIRYPLVAFAFYLYGRQQLAEQRAM